MNDSYSATRIQVMKSRLIKSSEYDRLLKMSEMEIISHLQTTEYREDIDALALKDLDDLETVDRIIARNTARILHKLKHISSDGFTDALLFTLHENDKWNLKVIAESIVGNKDPRDALARYAKRGTFNPVRFAGAKSIQELCEQADIKITALRKHPKTLTEFADVLARDTIRPPERSERYLIDEKNLSRLLMLKREKIGQEDIMKRMLRGGTVSRDLLRKAAGASSFDNTIKELRTTRYGTIIEHAQASLMKFEYELHHDVLRRIRRVSGTYPLSPDVLVRYLAEKDIESSNIRLLIKGKRLGLDESFLREQLVI